MCVCVFGVFYILGLFCFLLNVVVGCWLLAVLVNCCFVDFLMLFEVLEPVAFFEGFPSLSMNTNQLNKPSHRVHNLNFEIMISWQKQLRKLPPAPI